MTNINSDLKMSQLTNLEVHIYQAYESLHTATTREEMDRIENDILTYQNHYKSIAGFYCEVPERLRLQGILEEELQ